MLGGKRVTAFASPQRALEVRIGRERLAVPVHAIARVLPMQYAPLPLAHQLVIGVGFDAARTIVCISMSSFRAPGEETTAVLFESAGSIGYGLCIEEALELVDVTAVDRGTVPASHPRWVRRAHTADGRMLGWIDAAVLIDDITAGAIA